GHSSCHNSNIVAQNTVPVQIISSTCLVMTQTTLVQAAAATHPQAVVTKVPGVIHHQQPQQQLTNSITLDSRKLHLPNQSHTTGALITLLSKLNIKKLRKLCNP
ncbi:unnamed protein product, partial [Ceratitis capitata]